MSTSRQDNKIKSSKGVETFDMAAQQKKNKEKTLQKQKLDLEKKEYAEKLEAWFDYALNNNYNLSESKVAKEIGISQKSMNRYRNGMTLPSEEIQERIEKYFENIQEEVYTDYKREFLEEESDRYDEQWEEEEKTAKECAKEKAGFCSDGLSVYTPETQQYIVDNFELLWMVEKRELMFIRRYRELEESRKRKVLHMLETVPISLAMVQANGRDKQTDNLSGIYRPGPRIVGSGSHRWLEVICKKNEIYHNFLQKKYLPPKNLFNNYDLKQNNYFKISKPELEEKFDEQCIEMAYETLPNCYIHLGDESTSSFYERICVFHRTYYDNLNEILKFTTEEWYLLYLLSRMQIADFVDENMLDTYCISDDYHVQEREALLWTYLDMI